MRDLLNAARQALAALEYIYHTADPGPARDVSMEALDALRTAIAEAEKTHCRYPECVENEREECQQCYQQALEDAARMLMAEHERRWHNDNHALFFAHKVRALGAKGIVMTYTTNPRNVLPNGLTLLQQNPDCAAKLDPTAKDHGWLYTRRAETDWRWVTLRKLSDAEIETAYDQAADMVVLHGTKVRAG